MDGYTIKIIFLMKKILFISVTKIVNQTGKECLKCLRVIGKHIMKTKFKNFLDDLDDFSISQSYYNIIKSVRKIIYNKFCTTCGKWLYKKDFIIDNDKCFCSQKCLEFHKELWKTTKKIVEILIEELFPKEMLVGNGEYTDVKSIDWDNENSDPMPKIIDDIYKLEK